VITQTSDGKDIYFNVQGSGPDILLVHGAASDADAMIPLVFELSGRYRCIIGGSIGVSALDSPELDVPPADDGLMNSDRKQESRQ
jgi:hypothetical protein